ncbi:MmgE/PrpD family protein [Streptomyces sp. NBC_01716]|uniref:MmgE/PrpD family protein n=1 Tax=Streptomyces sp. NBC_01716 TaxID=2975917 RepID=UPI002E32FEA9|nr:MmgE/PrpD family protein [Streptomyces sp. NBC_01716]
MSYLTDICDDLATKELTQIPDTAVKAAKMALVDYFGVAIAGSQHPDTQRITTLAAVKNRTGDSAVLGTSLRATPEYAALHNGTAAHAYDHDDFSIIAHPTAPVAPAAFAVAESRGRSGQDALRAYLLAGEIMFRIGRRCLPYTSDQGWHTTGVFGALGASVAAGIAAQLPTAQVAAALGIAASEASGLRGNFGSPVKAYHCGMAARAGILSAELAEVGMHPSSTIIEGVDGYLQLFGGLAPETVTYSPDETWSILDPGIHTKRYACCSSMAPAIDALLESDEVANLDPENIVTIDVGQSPWSYKELVYPMPSSAAETKFSMQYAVASALIFRGATLEVFNDEAYLQHPSVRPLMQRVRTYVDTEFARRDFTADAPVRINITLQDGGTIQLTRDFAKGNTRNPLSEDEVHQKFLTLAAPRLGSERADRLLNGLMRIEDIENLSDLTRM